MKSTIIFFALCLCSFNCFGQCREAEYDPSERPFSGTVKICKDYRVYRSIAKINRLDSDELLQPGYTVKLPSRIIDHYASSNEYVVSLGCKQSVYIRVSLRGLEWLKPDSIYIPSDNDIWGMVGCCSIDNLTPGFIKRNKRRADRITYVHSEGEKRKNLIIHKQGVTVLLYNIKRRKFDKLFEMINESLEIDTIPVL